MADAPKLNPEQLRAVKHKTGPLLIIAGAGTGKTTVITERVKYLISKGLAKPEEILALTFTEKSAREMEERIDKALPYGYTQMWVMTFHSFCDRILRREALHIGLDPRYKLMTESEMIQLVRSSLFDFDLNYFRPLGNPNKFIGGMLQHFSRLQDEDVSPGEYLKFAREPEHKELARAYQKYEELKIKKGYLDFGDLITKILKLFRDRPNILKEYQKQFKYILVDEFQDTNIAQNELIKLLAGQERQPAGRQGNISVVADDDQSVYRFRGAAVSNVLAFRKDFPKTKIIVLTKNYRSTQEILDRAYDLIQFNNPDRLEVVEKINKKLVAVSPTSRKASRGDLVHFIHVDRVENEADAVAKEILSLRSRMTDCEYRDFAILVRANNYSEPFVRALSRHGIPYQFLGPGRLFKQPEIIDLISYLKILYDFTDSVSFYRLLSSDYFKVSGRELAELGIYARKNNISLFEAAEKIGGDESLKLVELVKKHLDLVKKESAGQILYYFLQDSGMLQKLLSPDSAEAQKRATNISKFFDKLKTYEVDHEDASVRTVVDWLDLAIEMGESPLASDSDWSEVDAVNILTVHSAKGLEFPVVFLVNLVSQRFPTIERREQIPIPEELIKETLPKGDYHLEEERRLFYVGMTRAKEKLFLTAADYYGEGKREKKLSPFIFEALGEGASEPHFAEASRGKQLSFLDYKPSGPEAALGRRPEPLHIDYLSYSQIETFKTCPLHYKLKYIFKVPTPTSASQSFGTSIHATLKDFYKAAINDKSHFAKASRDYLEKLMFQFLEGSWIKEGFTSKTHEKKFFAKGKLYLSGFLKESFDPKIIPSLLEEPFVIPLDPTSHKASRGLRVGGKIDRVDQLPDGSIEIIDYKTGAAMPTQKEVDKNLQLSFYALAATTIPTKPLGIKPNKIKLSLYFLDQQEKISTTRTKAQLDAAVEEIFVIKKEIENSDFTCSGSFLCKNCEYKLLCNSGG